MKGWWFPLIMAFLCFQPIALAQDEDESEDRSTLQVEINGVSGQLLTNVRNRLSVYEYNNQPIPGPGRVRYLHRRAEQEILRALAPAGYYRARVDSEFNREDGVWRLIYNITPGTAMQIRNVDIQIEGEATDDTNFERLQQSLNIQPGQNLHHRNYENAKNRLRSLAAERGYRDASFTTSELQIDLQDYAADIILHFDSGPRYRFGNVQFSESHLDEDILQRFVHFESGEYISSDELIELQMNLSDSDYFSRVQIQPQWAEASDDHVVPVSITLEPNARTHYRAGIGYGTDTGARVSFEQNRRWVNRRGHRFNSQFQFSELLSSVGANYIIPGAQPQTDQYVLRAGWRDEDTDTTKSELINLGVSWQRQLERTQRTVSLDWQDERDMFGDERRRTQFLMPGVQWDRVHTANRLNVREGFRLVFGVRGASQAMLSSTNFTQFNLGGKYILPFAERYRLLTRADLGTTIADDFSRIPTSLRFYAGGDNSIRGYGYRTVGPRDDEGFMLGGRHLMVGSVEVDYEFRPNWRVATFVDSGRAFDNINTAFRHGAGFGVRWQSPVGPIRIDLAHGFGPEGNDLRLHLTLGPDL